MENQQAVNPNQKVSSSLQKSQEGLENSWRTGLLGAEEADYFLVVLLKLAASKYVLTGCVNIQI